MAMSEDEAKNIVETLLAQPNEQEILNSLENFEPFSTDPSQSSSAVIYAVVNTTIPSLWPTLAPKSRISKLIVSCLGSVSGVNALLMLLIQGSFDKASTPESNKIHLETLVEVLTLVLESDKFSPRVVIQRYREYEPKGSLLMNEYISLVAGSKILNSVSKAAKGLDIREQLWIVDGKRYTKWLGDGTARAIKSHGPIPEVSNLVGKAMNLGYPYVFVEALMPQMFNCLDIFSNVLITLHKSTQRSITKYLIQYLSEKYLNYSISRDGSHWWESDRSRVGAVATTLHEIYSQRAVSQILVDNIKNISGLEKLSMQRACVLAVSKLSRDHLTSLTDFFVALWADKVSILHTPIMRQEAFTQLLLLCLAHTDFTRLKQIAHSPIYNDGLSNRLSASVDRVRFLGLIVGEALSRKVDPEGKRLQFKVPETEDADAETWRSMIDVDDELASLSHLASGIVEEYTESNVQETNGIGSLVTGEPLEEEVGTDLDKDLPKYSIPESDTEDSDDDPTLVSHEKISKPLYIRDLIKYLRDDKYEKVNLGLKTAPTLIRQKARFGTELRDHAEHLARVLVVMQDTFQMEKFEEMRQAALIAVVASAPENVASYLINTYFGGDLSIQQRCILLSALGIGARELAGLEKPDTIPVQLLPPEIHQQYYSPMDQLALQLEATMIEPMRKEAISKLSGPEILQVNRSSSRLIEKRKVKTTVNSLSKIAGQVFLFPLLGRWWIQYHDYGARGIHFEPILLSTFTRTVGIILFASAPSALDLRQMTREFWDFLLSLRSVSNDPSVTESILFGLLVILEITEPRPAAENFPKQVVETKSWTSEIFPRLDDGGKSKMLAGAVLLKVQEIITKHERLLWGTVISAGSISSAPLGLNFR